MKTPLSYQKRLARVLADESVFLVRTDSPGFSSDLSQQITAISNDGFLRQYIYIHRHESLSHEGYYEESVFVGLSWIEQILSHAEEGNFENWKEPLSTWDDLGTTTLGVRLGAEIITKTMNGPGEEDDRDVALFCHICKQIDECAPFSKQIYHRVD